MLVICEKCLLVMMILMRDKVCVVWFIKVERVERLCFFFWSVVSSLSDECIWCCFVCDIVVLLLMCGLCCFKKVINGIKWLCKFLSNVGFKEYLSVGFLFMYRVVVCIASSVLFVIFIVGDSGCELLFKFVWMGVWMGIMIVCFYVLDIMWVVNKYSLCCVDEKVSIGCTIVRFMLKDLLLFFWFCV